MSSAIFWHRRDLRIHDNAGLYKALSKHQSVQSVFIFDQQILQHLPANDQRVLFIYQEIEKLKQAYQELGADLKVYFGHAETQIVLLAQELKAEVVYANRDYEPQALLRDTAVFEALKKQRCHAIKPAVRSLGWHKPPRPSWPEHQTMGNTK